MRVAGVEGWVKKGNGWGTIHCSKPTLRARSHSNSVRTDLPTQGPRQSLFRNVVAGERSTPISRHSVLYTTRDNP